jgi:glycosyltransferase involved in cell wall biosynthesis
VQQKPKIIMVGPDIEGLGGISRVVRIWRTVGVFSENDVQYIATATDRDLNKVLYLLKAFVSFLVILIQSKPVVYVHTSSYNSFRRKSLFIATAIILRRKVILHIHPTHFYSFLLNLKGIEKTWTQFLLNRIDGLVVLTEEMRANIEKIVPGKPVYILRNPVIMNEMNRHVKIKRAENRLLYLGWYIREKGVYDLVDAIEMLTIKKVEVYLDFYGTKQVNELRTYVKNKHLEAVITVNDWIGDVEKCEALLRATALILPSYSEGIPNVILEAMAFKTPIISTLVGGLKEVLRDGENAIIFKVGNPNDLSEKILKCLTDVDLRNRIAKNAYQEACMKYDASIMKKELSSMINHHFTSPHYKEI